MREIPLSVRRLVATVEVDGLNVAAFCREHGISRESFYAIRRRYRLEGEVGLVPRSRAPVRPANRTSDAVEDRVVELRKRLVESGWDGGAASIRDRLVAGGEPAPSESTIWRILSRRGFIVPEPKKAPTRVWRRFEADLANERWQIDATTVRLGSGRPIEVVDVIDDATRVCVASLVTGQTTGTDAWAAITTAGEVWGLPASILSDNGAPFTSVLFTTNLTTIGTRPIHSSRSHPQTCGKVERFHQTVKRFLTAHQPIPSPQRLQQLLDHFADHYNHQRPHRALNRATPAAVFADTPKAAPGDLPAGTATSIHHNTVDRNGRVEIPGPAAITLGAAYAGATATTIRTGNHAHVFIDHHLIRSLTIDPTRRNQPLYNRPGRPT